MKKEQLEQSLINYWEKRFERQYKNLNEYFIARLLVVGAGFSFLYSINFWITQSDFAISLAIMLVIYLMHTQVQAVKFYSDRQNELFEHIKNNTIEKFGLKEMTSFERNVFYKEKKK